CGCVEKPVKCIADLYSRQFDIEISLRKPERIECVIHCEGEMRIRPVLSRQCSGIQSSRVVAAPLLGCGKRHPVISGRRVRHLVRCKSITASGNGNILVQMQRLSKKLIHNIMRSRINFSAAVKENADIRCPLFVDQFSGGVGIVPHKSTQVQFANVEDVRTRREVELEDGWL